MSNDLPLKVSKVGGNFKVAANNTREMWLYADKAGRCIQNVHNSDLGPLERGGALRQADEYLDTVIKLAEAARKALRISYYD